MKIEEKTVIKEIYFLSKDSKYRKSYILQKENVHIAVD